MNKLFRIFCIVFAIIGIPLTLSVLADLGAILATIINKLCTYMKTLRPVRKYKLISNTLQEDGNVYICFSFSFKLDLNSI